jgi:5-oxopent-3-ene-1,2,5-tricarboxylate decarboxylase/2-hydroxyhepta-2,4-diene-1,7-dioate isomerase
MDAPNNIHCLALNYPGVGEDSSETPLYFVKSRNAYCESGSRIPYPVDSDFFWTEVELGIVVDHDCHNVSLEQAREAIRGFVVCADLSCKNIYNRDHHLGFSKSRAFFCPTSDKLAHPPERDWRNLRMTTEVNGELTQEGTTAPMMLGPIEAIHYISRITRISQGDLIITGTPLGWKNNKLKQGDFVRHQIEQVGELEFEIE